MPEKRETWIAVCCPNLSRNEEGFETEEKAWEWIKDNGLCSDCLKELKKGGTLIGDGKEAEWIEIDHPSDTGCGTEWLVTPSKRYENCEDFGDILEAAGYEKEKNKEDK